MEDTSAEDHGNSDKNEQWHSDDDSVDEPPAESLGQIMEEYGEEIDIVEALGEERLRRMIQNTWSLVLVPTNQPKLIQLFKEAGFVSENNCANAVGDFPNTTERMGSGDQGGASEGEEAGDAEQPNDQGAGNGKQPNKGKWTKKYVQLRKIRTTWKLGKILLCNQRADVPENDTWSLEMSIKKNTTIQDVKMEILRQWRVAVDEQFLWTAAPTEYPGDATEIFGAPETTLIDARVKARDIIYLRHKNEEGNLETGTNASLSPWWPLRQLLFHVTPWPLNSNWFDLNTYQGVAALPADPHSSFGPTFQMTAEKRYQPPWFVRSQSTMRLKLTSWFGVDHTIWAKTSRHKGYFVEKVGIKLDYGPGLIGVDASPTTNEGRSMDIVSTIKKLASRGFGLSTSEASLRVENQQETQQSNHLAASSDSWKFVQTGPGHFELTKHYWDYPSNDGKVETYPDFNKDKGVIPKVQRTCKKAIKLVLEHQEGRNCLAFPSLGALLRGDGEKAAREGNATIRVEVEMTMRKIQSRSIPQDPWKIQTISPERAPFAAQYEYQDSFRRVVIRGDMKLCEFPENIYCGGCCIALVSVLVGMVGLLLAVVARHGELSIPIASLFG